MPDNVTEQALRELLAAMRALDFVGPPADWATGLERVRKATRAAEAHLATLDLGPPRDRNF